MSGVPYSLDGDGPTNGAAGFKAGRTTYALAWLAETWERLWPSLVWAFSVLCIFAAVSWFGLWLRLPDLVRFAGLGLFGVVLAASLWPLRQFRFPSRAEILHRIERVSGLAHRPVTAQEDSMARPGDAFSEALWRVHRERMAARLKNLSAGMAKPDATRFDKYAVHAFLPIIAFVAWGFSQTPSGGRLVDAFSPHIDAATVLSRLDAWVDYPDYAAKPPVYLSRELKPEGMRSTTVLAGSELHLRYVGDEDVSLRYVAGDGTATDLAPEEQGVAGKREAAFAAKLDRPGTVEFYARGKPVARWPLEVTPDEVPQIEFAEAPSASQTGSLELSYSVKDDYGVVSARGLIEPVEKPAADARPLVEAPELALPLPRARAKSGTTRVNRDLTSHPWAGSEVEITLEATDDPGQVGRSAPHRMTLPGRNFTNPLARALVEQRRILAMDANRSRYVADMLDAVSSHPDIFKIPAGPYMAMRAAYRMISPGDDDTKLRDSLDLLWETALNLELGNLSEVERRLREAQEKLSDALENGATDEEIQKLMEELRQAMNDFLEQLAKEMAKNPMQQNQSNMNNMQTLTQRDLERMMDRIENLARSGSKDAARELLSEMQRMMDSLMAGRQQQQQQQGQQQSQLNQALDKLSELMQRQQQLMDETFSMRQRQPQQGEQQQGQQGQQSQNRDQQGEGQQNRQQGQNQQGQQGGEQGENGPMTPEEFAQAMENLRQQQEALQQQLDALSEQLMQQGLDPSKEFGEAGQEMGKAGDNLGEGQPGPAAGNQGQALEALRRGAQSMLNQLAQQGQQPGQQQGQQQGPGGERQSRADPLGRQQQNEGGRFNESGTKIPGEIDAQRAREIMDAIRRRLADPLRPLIERNYLERLLESR